MKQNFIFYTLFSLLLLFISSCKEENEIVLPAVQTDSATSISISSAELNGAVSDEGGSAVTARGFCVSEDPNPDLNDVLESSGFGPGEFSEEIFNLQPNTTYYYKAFATNGVGTAFGQEFSFTTEQVPDPGPTLNLKGGFGYTSSDVTIAPGELIRVGVVGISSHVSSNKLVRFKMTETSMDFPAILLDSVLNSENFDWDTYLSFLADPGSLELEFEITDAGGMKASRTLHLTIASSQNTERYNNVELGSWNDAIGSFFATSEGIIYNIAQTYAVPANQAKIDFLFFKGMTLSNTIASPDDVDANAIADLKLNLWLNKNQTRFNTTSMTAAQFDAIGASYEFPEFDFSSQMTKASQLSVGDVILIKTQSNKLGLIKIESLYTKGDKMKIDVVMEK